MKNNPSYIGQPVQLNSCSTGGTTADGSANLAQQVANSLGVNVVAPTNDIFIYFDGHVTMDNAGMWRIFTPNRVPLK